MTQVLKYSGRDLSDFALVLDNQDRESVLVIIDTSSRVVHFNWFARGSGKGDGDAGPFANITLNIDRAPRLLHKAKDLTESQPCALAHVFCSEKGLEDAMEDLSWHAMAAVSNAQLDLGPTGMRH